MRLYPVGGAPWRRFVLAPIGGSWHRLPAVPIFSLRARRRRCRRRKAPCMPWPPRFAPSPRNSSVLPRPSPAASHRARGPLGSGRRRGSPPVLGRSLGLSPEKVKALLPVGARPPREQRRLIRRWRCPLRPRRDRRRPPRSGARFRWYWRPASRVDGSAAESSAIALSSTFPPIPVGSSSGIRHLRCLGHSRADLISVAFTKLLLTLRARFLRLPKIYALAPARWRGDLLVGVIGWFVPQVLGVGYGYVGDVLNGNMTLKLMLLLLVLESSSP